MTKSFMYIFFNYTELLMYYHGCGVLLLVLRLLYFVCASTLARDGSN